MTSATDAIVGDISEDDAGVAGGIQTTSIQLGGVLGTAVCGSILAASVTAALKSALTTRGVPLEVTQRLIRDRAIVSQGLAPVPDGAPRKLADAITAGSHAAFMTGLHATMLVAGFVALAGAAMGPLLRPTNPPRDQEAPEHGPVEHHRDNHFSSHLAEPLRARQTRPVDASSPAGPE